MIWIFDLDQTVIDSSHRAIDGVTPSAFLRDWKSHSREQILQDALLPLGKFMKHLIAKNEFVMICTARNMSGADFELLDNLGINCKVIISRGANDNRQDADYKLARISQFIKANGYEKRDIVLFDDKQEIREVVSTLPNVNCFDPRSYNGGGAYVH